MEFEHRADDHSLNMFATGRQTVGDPSVATCLMMICIFSQLHGKKKRREKHKKLVCAWGGWAGKTSSCFSCNLFIFIFIYLTCSLWCLFVSEKIKTTEQLIPMKSVSGEAYTLRRNMHWISNGEWMERQTTDKEKDWESWFYQLLWDGKKIRLWLLRSLSCVC